MDAEPRPTGVDAFDGTASTLLGFEPHRYLVDPASYRERAQADSESLHELTHARDWQAVTDAAAGMMDHGTRRLRKLLRGRTAMNDVTAAAADLRTYAALRDHGDGTPSRETLVAGLRALNDESARAVVPESTLRALDSGDAPTTDPFDRREDDWLASYDEVLRHQRDVATWYVAAGYENVARVGLYSVAERVKPVEHRPSDLASFEDELDAIRRETTARFRALHSALAGAAWDDLDAHALRATSYPEEVLVDLLGLAWRLRQGRLYEREVDGNPGQAADFARAELELHWTLRLLELLLAAGHRLRFVARRGEADETARAAADDAADKRFESLVRDGVNVDLDDLLDAADDYDDRLVEVEGYADDVRFVTGDGSGTKFDLVDRLHDRRVPVFYPYRDLTAWHLYDGAYVRVEATFDADSEWTDGPELVLDAVNVGENAGESWFDALVNEFHSAGVLELYPSRGNAVWSIELPPESGGHHHGDDGSHDHHDDGGADDHHHDDGESDGHHHDDGGADGGGETNSATGGED